MTQVGGDAGLMVELLHLFIGQARELERRLVSTSALELAGDLHRLRGSAQAIAAEAVAGATAALEAASDAGPGADAARRVLRAALDDTCRYAASLIAANDGIGLAKSPESR